MNTKPSGRRRFLRDGAALAGLALGAGRSASGATLGTETPQAHPKGLHAYGERSRFEARYVLAACVDGRQKVGGLTSVLGLRFRIR
jgi:hypothetical protein